MYREPMNDKIVYYLDRSKLEDRLANSIMARRLIEESIFKNLCPTEVDFDAICVWSILVQRGEEWLQTTDPTTADRKKDNTRHYVTLQQLPCVKSVEVFKTLFTEGMKHLPGDEFRYSVSLQLFSPWPLDDPSINKHQAKAILAEALKRFEEFFCFTCGDIYTDVTASLRDNILYGTLGRITWESSYVRHLVESSISAVLKDVKLTSTSLFRQRKECNVEDISSPIGVRALLYRVLGSIKPVGDHQNLFLRSAPIRLTKTLTGGTRTAGGGGGGNGSNGGVSSSAKVKNELPFPSAQPASLCKTQFLHDLGVTTQAGTVYPACSRPDCIYSHKMVGKATKAVLTTRLKLLTDLPKPMLAGVVLTKTQAAIDARP
jgi:hypothetical protein